MFKLGFIKRLLWFINIAAALSLALGFSASYISPAFSWPIAYFGLAFPLIFLINVGFVIFWLLQRKIHTLLSLVLVIISWNSFSLFYALNSKNTKQIDAIETNNGSTNSSNAIKVMSYNVKTFNYYNWRNNKELRKRLLSVIKVEDPDILCIQEFFTSDITPFQMIDSLMHQLSFKDYYFEKLLSVRDVDHFGIITFSRFPIIRKGRVKYTTSTLNTSIYTDVVYEGDTIRVYNCHLQSLYFEHDDYYYLNHKKDVTIDASKKLFSKLKAGYVRRAKQTDIVAKHIHNSPYPVLLCGDLNDTPVSYSYGKLSNARKFQDSFRSKGRGFGSTYAGPVPFLRIDYIFAEKEFEIQKYYEVNKKYSDHFPIVCVFKLK